MKENLQFFKKKSSWARRETVKLHKRSPETRLASALSCIEIFVVLFYGKILRYNPKDYKWERRDRLIISKGHGGISLYPILSDLGFLNKKFLHSICKPSSILIGIPDSSIPGFETINGSLGHGLGVGCGVALALKDKNIDSTVFVVCGDGKLFEGAIWKAVMFASHHRLDNLIRYRKILCINS